MGKEFRIKHEDIADPQTITEVNEREFKKHGLDTHLNEVDEIVDDFKKKERIYKVRNKKYFIMGGGTDGT